MANSYTGQIIAVGFNFAPENWIICDGSLLSVSAHQALFALIGVTYGGDGINYFAVPDLRGRLAISQGQAPGQANYTIGQTGGQESVTLLPDQIARHGHGLMASGKPGTSDTPGATMALALNTQEKVAMYSLEAPDVALAPGSIQATSGGSLPHENRQPTQVITYLMCTDGIFPSRG